MGLLLIIFIAFLILIGKGVMSGIALGSTIRDSSLGTLFVVFLLAVIWTIVTIGFVYPWFLNIIMSYMGISYVFTWKTVLCLTVIRSIFLDSDTVGKVSVLWKERKK